MQTFLWCKRSTFLYVPANFCVSCSAVKGRQWKFAHIRSYLSPGTKVTPTQGACEKEALMKESLKMETLRWWKKSTFLFEAAKTTASHAAP